ncbi:MAG TPA: glycosyltransferase family 1 protein [Gammaproteobacteria bacterium]|nr:glycosyltransferase family 1 protein [Gammaproteobacteria bacterium]
MNRKKILFCESNIDGTIGGSFYSLFYLVEGLDKSKYEPCVIFYQQHSLLPLFNKAGIKTEIFILPKPVHLTLFDNGFLGVFRKPVKLIQSGVNFYRFFIRQSLKYRKYIIKNKIDLVHLNNTILRNHNWMLAARLSGIKCVTHERGVNNYFPYLARFFARHIDAIICISGAVEDNLKNRGMDSGQLVKIFNGIDPDCVIVEKEKNEILDKYNIPHSSPVIGIVGNIRGWKGQEIVVRAISIIKLKYPEIRCFIVGDYSENERDYYEHLQSIIDKLNIVENVIFTGYQSNVASFMNAMEIVIHASILPEPFGRVLIEAMALSKALVGSNEGAVPEIIVEGKTGLMFDVGDYKGLADIVISLLDNPEYRKQIGENGRVRLNEEFHIKRNVELTQKLYEKLLA